MPHGHPVGRFRRAASRIPFSRSQSGNQAASTQHTGSPGYGSSDLHKEEVAVPNTLAVGLTISLVHGPMLVSCNEPLKLDQGAISGYPGRSGGEFADAAATQV